MKSIRFPNIKAPLGLGVGMDLPWGAEIGFTSDGDQGDRPQDRVLRFFEQYQRDYHYYFFSFQPKNRNASRANDYFEAYDHLTNAVPLAKRSLHQTTLNLGCMGEYDRSAVVAFTNALIRRYDLQWINEDLGVWSLEGKVMPYPLPPLLTEAGLNACKRNVAFYQERLEAPLLVEFPGFSEGTNFFIGKLNGFEFFSRVVEETGSPCTLDTGHILSYAWLMGQGFPTTDVLNQLPLENCFEIHLSGCQIIEGRFMDFHHGILMDQQLDLLDWLLEHCPNVKGITYEDPKFKADGTLIPKSVQNYKKLKQKVEAWSCTRQLH